MWRKSASMRFAEEWLIEVLFQSLTRDVILREVVVASKEFPRRRQSGLSFTTLLRSGISFFDASVFRLGGGWGTMVHRHLRLMSWRRSAHGNYDVNGLLSSLVW